MLKAMAQGALAGLIGTAAMTALGMKPGAARLLPPGIRPRRFLPRKVVRQGRRRLGVAMGDAEEVVLTGVLHLAYGAAAGALYGMLRAGRRLPPGGGAGAGYGLTLWAAGYEGWIPALGLLPPTTADRPARWIVPVGSHLIFGTATALAFGYLRRPPSGPA